MQDDWWTVRKNSCAYASPPRNSERIYIHTPEPNLVWWAEPFPPSPPTLFEPKKFILFLAGDQLETVEAYVDSKVDKDSNVDKDSKVVDEELDLSEYIGAVWTRDGAEKQEMEHSLINIYRYLAGHGWSAKEMGLYVSKLL